MDSEEERPDPREEENFRQRLSRRIFKISDRVERFGLRVFTLEDELFRKLPLPSKAVRRLSDVVTLIAFEVDDPCPECGCSPSHKRECSRYCSVKYVMES